MLILSRKTGESLVLAFNPEDIPASGEVRMDIKVIRQLNGAVSLGIQAPRCIRVDREEIAEAKAAQRDGVELKTPQYRRKRQGQGQGAMARAFTSATSVVEDEDVVAQLAVLLPQE